MADTIEAIKARDKPKAVDKLLSWVAAKDLNDYEHALIDRHALIGMVEALKAEFAEVNEQLAEPLAYCEKAARDERAALVKQVEAILAEEADGDTYSMAYRAGINRVLALLQAEPTDEFGPVDINGLEPDTVSTETVKKLHELAKNVKDIPIDLLDPDEPQSVCRWHEDGDDEYSDGWHGECGIHWVFADGGPVENGMYFCPGKGCGKPLVVGPSEEVSNEEA